MPSNGYSGPTEVRGIHHIVTLPVSKGVTNYILEGLRLFIYQEVGIKDIDGALDFYTIYTSGRWLCFELGVLFHTINWEGDVPEYTPFWMTKVLSTL